MVKENTSKKLAPGDAFLSVRGITKEFSTVRVLDQIDLDIRAGEVMGLIGENGAGKSTLIKIISGIYQPTAGSVYLDGEEVSIRNYGEAKALGISIVPQEFNLINTLTVYENIFLGNEVLLRSGLLDKGEMRRQSIEQLEQLKMSLNVNRLVGDLSVAEKQMVEISKALMLHARILIMDEPTTMLTGHEVETLFNLMRELKRQGVTIIFVSHKLKEVKAICDRVTVLRDGLLISVDPIEEVEERDLARKMIGRDFTQVFPAKKIRDRDDVILEVKNLGVRNLIHDVSFSLRRGEILGFAGLVGAGRTELFEAIMGLRRVEGGTIAINGEEAKIRHPRDAVDLGMGYISEDRQGKGIVANFDVPKNITLITLKDYKKHLLIDFKKEERRAEEFRKTFRIVAASQKAALRFFSGGNQQKVYLARWVETEPEILIFDEPTRGIDVNSKREIYEFIHLLAERGVSCVIISSEMEEVIGLCSRVYVMREGTIAGCLSGEHINEEEIMFHATGIKGREAYG